MTFARALLFAALLIFPLSAAAQADLAGAWVMALTPPGGQAMRMPVEAAVQKDSLRLTMPSHDGSAGLSLEEVSMDDGTLRFVIPSGHGRIACTLYRDEKGEFSGICAGPMGEGATTLRRKKAR